MMVLKFYGWRYNFPPYSILILMTLLMEKMEKLRFRGNIWGGVRKNTPGGVW
jgi:hypothetical protein